MTIRRFLPTLAVILIGTATASAQQPQQTDVAGQVQSLLRVHCYSCHGQDEKKIKANLRVLDHAQLIDARRQTRLVVAGDPAASELFHRVEDGTMPPGNRPKLTEGERELLRNWIASGAPAFPDAKTTAVQAPVVNPPSPPTQMPPEKPSGTDVITAARNVFTTHCLDCHGGKKITAGVKVLDRDLLTSRNFVVPGKPNESPLLRLVQASDDGRMPPPPRPAITAEQVEAIRGWIAAGAPSLTPPAPKPQTPSAGPVVTTPAPKAETPSALKGPLGTEYVLQNILADVRVVPQQDRRFIRYFSLLHILNAGTSKEELNQYRDAFAKAINHLSWKPEIVRPTPIEATHTIFRIDIRDVGWDHQPYQKIIPGKFDRPNGLNLFDLVLLEYPYGALPDKSDLYFPLLRDYLVPAGMVRPIPFVRADWFVSVATQPPLYHDLLQLPETLPELEQKLSVDAAADVTNGRAPRAGMIVSGVSRNNRVVERHSTPFGAYWKSFDFRTSQAQENMFQDPIDLHPSGGEMIFHLPNGLQGYLIVDAQGHRLDAAPTNIVVDGFSSDKVVHNGLSCMRCHDRGVKGFADTVRPAVLKLPPGSVRDRRQVLQLYPEQTVQDKLLKTDEDRFMTALSKALGKTPAAEPLRPVTARYLDDRLSLDSVSAELGLPQSRGLQEVFRLPQFVEEGLAPLAAKEQLPRDAWEANYDHVVTQMGLGTPVVPLDGLTRLKHEPDVKPFDLEIKTNRRGNLFATGDDLAIFVKPSKDVFIEVIGTNSHGFKTILAPATTHLKAGQTMRFPPEGHKFTVKSTAGQALITVFASEAAFPGGELLRGDGVTDRVVHTWPIHIADRRAEVQFAPDPAHTVKRTVVLEVR